MGWQKIRNSWAGSMVMVSMLAAMALAAETAATANEPAEYYSNRAVEYAGKGQWDQAIADYTKALEKNPRSVNDYINRAAAYMQKSNFVLALKDFNKALEINPQEPRGYTNRGWLFLIT